MYRLTIVKVEPQQVGVSSISHKDFLTPENFLCIKKIRRTNSLLGKNFFVSRILSVATFTFIWIRADLTQSCKMCTGQKIRRLLAYLKL